MFVRPFSTLLGFVAVSYLLVLCETMGVASTTVRDLSPAAAEYKAVIFLVERKIMDVDAGSNFRPSLLVTKLDLAKYLYNLVSYYKLDATGVISSDDLNKLQNRVAALERQLQGANLANVIQELTDLKRRVATLESGLSSVDGRTALTPQAFAALSAEVDVLRKRLADLESRFQRLDAAELSNLRNQLADLQRRLQAAETRMTLLEGRTPTTTGNVAQLSSDLEALKQRVNELERSNRNISDTARAIDEFRTRISTLELDLRESQALGRKIAELEQRISGAERTLQNVPNALALASQIQELQATGRLISQLETNVANVTTRVQTLEGKLGEIEVQVKRFYTELQNLPFAAELDRFKDRLGVVEGRVGELGALDKTVNELSKSIAESVGSLEKVRTDLSRLGTKLDQLEPNVTSEFAAVRESLKIAELKLSELEVLGKKVSEIERGMRNQVSALEELSRMLTELGLETSALRRTVDARFEQLDRRILELSRLQIETGKAFNTELEALKERVGDAEVRVAELQVFGKKLSEVSNELGDARSSLETLGGKVARLESKVAQLEPSFGSEIETLRGRVGDLELKLAELQVLDKRVTELTNTLRDSGELVGRIEGKLSELESKVGRLEPMFGAELETLKEKVRDAEVRMVELQVFGKKLSEVSNELGDARSSLETLGGKVARLESKVAQLEPSFGSEIETLRGRVGNLEVKFAELQVLDRKVSDLDRIVNEPGGALEQLRQKVTQLEAKLERLEPVNPELSSIKGRLSDVEVKVAELQVLDKKYTEISKTANELVDTLKGLSAKLGDIESQVGKLSVDLVNQPFERELAELKSQVRNIELKLGELQVGERRIAEFAKMTQEANVSISSLSNELRLVKERLEKAESELADLRQRPAEILSQVQDLARRIIDLGVGVDELRLQLLKIPVFENLLKDFTSAVEQKASVKDLRDAENRLNEATRELRNLAAKYFELEQDVGTVKRRLGDVAGLLETIADGLTKLDKRETADFETLTARIEELTASVGKIETNLRELQRLVTSQLSLAERIQRLETAVNLSDELIRQLSGIDPLNLINFISGLQVLTNRFDQFELRFDAVRRDVVQPIDSRLRSVERELSRVGEVGQDLNSLRSGVGEIAENQEKLRSALDSANRRINELKGELELFKWLAVAGLFTSALLGIIMFVTGQ